jgi:predicted nucleic acid-binding Zn ribbon protein
MKRRAGPMRLGELIERAVGRPAIIKQLKAQRAMRLWPQCVGEGLAQKCRPTSFVGGRLTVLARSSAWAQELQFHKETIRQRFNELVGEDLVNDIRIQVGSFDDE